MGSIEQRQNEIVSEFSRFSDWEQRYRHLIQLGQELRGMDESLKVEENKVSGCQSQVWMVVTTNESRQLEFMADSEALIVRGLLSLLLRVYSRASCSEILHSSSHFIVELGLDHHLSPSRANGLHSMIKKIKYYAMAYQALLNKN